MPNSFAETPEGLLLIADGFGPVLRWDGFTFQAELAGVVAPTTAPTINYTGRGAILGTYRAYLRFVDAYGNFSDLSPVSADLDVFATGGSVTGANTSTPITLTIPSHGLSTGAVIRVDGVNGQTGANGVWTVSAVNTDQVILVGSTTGGTYTTGGTWVSGADRILYTGIQAATDPQVVRRQLLRNTDGQANTYYVDVDTDDLSGSSFFSSRSDTNLATRTSVPVTNASGDDLANIYARPPQDKAFMAHNQSRMFYTGEVEYAEGAVKVEFGSATVRGIATEWGSAVAGRFLYVVNSNSTYEIASVDTENQTLTLVSNYLGVSDPFSSYSIRPEAARARSVAYSESGKAEAVPALNELTIPDDGDQITGLMVSGSFVYILERRHIYRLTFQDDPQGDGALFPAGHRGCVNHRCVAIVEDAAYMLDERGVHVYDHGEDRSISTPIQTLFRPDANPRINWAASRFFHCVADHSTETIRWFVSLSGQYLPRHAICYQYTLQRWWIEEYSRPVGCSVVGKLARQAARGTWGVGREEVFLGTSHRNVLALAAGPLDGPNPASGITGGDVVSSGVRSLTASESFSSDVVNSNVAIISGKGKGQNRIIVDVDGATLFLKQPWLVKPDATSKFQVGAIVWKYQTGWLRYVDAEDNNVRRAEVMFEPNDTTIVMRRFRDRLTEPTLSSVTRSSDGVSSVMGSGDIELDLDRSSGFVQHRFDGSKETYTHGQRLVSLELSGYGGEKPVRIFQITLDGVQPAGGSN